MTIGQIRSNAVKALVSKDVESYEAGAFFILSPTPQLDADVIIGHFLHCDRTYIMFHRDDEVDEKLCKKIYEAIALRRKGLPVAYITGYKEFYGYDFYVTPDVLIPKPDTELMIDLALDTVRDKMLSHPDRILTVCDMCTGSGCVGLSLLKALAQQDNIDDNDLPKLTMVDISQKALDVAKRNAENLLSKNALDRVRLTQSNLFDFVPYTFDLIVTNPPYIPHDQARELLLDGRSEPLLALDGDVSERGDFSGSDDGLALIRRLIPQLYEHLSPKGRVIMETGEYNAEETAKLMRTHGFKNVHIEKDMNDMLRDVIGDK